jgi:FAD/FMN-containing dehydrogenase
VGRDKWRWHFLRRSISGEHGIGLDKKVHFRRETDDALLNIMRKTKEAFDPNNILNPGKIFDL